MTKWTDGVGDTSDKWNKAVKEAIDNRKYMSLVDAGLRHKWEAEDYQIEQFLLDVFEGSI